MSYSASYSASSSGVKIAADFRDNLIIDRYDPVFAKMRGKKLTHLCSENSEDAVTWNVFRSLRQIEAQAWLPKLMAIALPNVSLAADGPVDIDLWRTVSPPPSLLALGKEGDSEIDAIIETPSWVWVIEAKYRSDISTSTTYHPLRDQVLRNIDVGSHYAGARDFAFTLLIRDEASSRVGAETIARYADLAEPRRRLAGHRPDGLKNLKAVTLLTWENLGEVLRHARDSARRTDECGYAQRAVDWLVAKGIVRNTMVHQP